MQQKAEILQTYKGTTQTKRKNPKPGKFCPRGPKWRMESSFECLSKKANPLLDEVQSSNLATLERDDPNQRGKSKILNK
jgi:hypothetical protein